MALPSLLIADPPTPGPRSAFDETPLPTAQLAPGPVNGIDRLRRIAPAVPTNPASGPVIRRLTALQGEEILNDVARKGGNPRRYPQLRGRWHQYMLATATNEATVDVVRAKMTEGQLRELADQWWNEPTPTATAKSEATAAVEVEPPSAPTDAPTDAQIEKQFGYEIVDREPGRIEKVIQYPTRITPGPGLERSKLDGFVGAVATTPTHPPIEIAQKYRKQAFTGDADRRFRLAVVVNTRGRLMPPSGTDPVEAALEGVRDWPKDAFRIAAGGFVWHPWRRDGADVSITEVRQAFRLLPESGDGLTRKALLAYEEAKKTSAAMVPYGPARNRAYALTHQLAAEMEPLFPNVLIHFSDPDTPSFTAREGRSPSSEPRSGPSSPTGTMQPVAQSFSHDMEKPHGADEFGLLDKAVGESLVPLLTRYEQILRPMRDKTGALPPVVISGGYELRLQPLGDVQDPQALTLLGHRLDLAIRAAIAQARRAGASIYLPEPNLLIKWSPKLVQVSALFGEGNKESIFLVRNYRKLLTPTDSKARPVEVRYELGANAPTSTPDRFVLEKKEEAPVSIAKFSARTISADQLKRICNQSQCYARFDTWSIAVNDILEIKASHILPAFNACMITEQYHYDPQLIRAALPTFAMPGADELAKSLDATLGSVLKNADLRQSRIAELVELLHRTGAATMIFMDRLLNSSTIPDPVAEGTLFNGWMDKILHDHAPVTVALLAPTIAIPKEGPTTAPPTPDEQIVMGLAAGRTADLLKVVVTNVGTLAAESIAKYLEAIVTNPFKGSQAAVGNVCGSLKSKGRTAEVIKLLAKEVLDKEVGNTKKALRDLLG